jgi:hypothetical protein
MAEKITIDIDAKINAAESIKDLKELKKLLKETTAGSEDFKKLSAGIRELDDTIKDASATSDDFAGYLENAEGPLGAFGKGLRAVEKNFSSFNGALKASVIGIIVTSIGLLVTAFAKTEGSLKKLEPVMIGIEKIFGGLVNALQPFLDIILDLAMRALPAVTKAIAAWFGGIVSAFTFIKEVGGSIGDLLTGIFTGDGDKITKAYDRLKGSWDKTTKAYDEFQKNFQAGTEKQTATQKKNADDQAAIDAKRLADTLKHLDAQDKLDASELAKQKANALALAETDQQKLDVEKAFYEKSYKDRVKDLQDKQALYKKGTDEYKAIQTELNQADAERTLALTAFSAKQIEITKNNQKELYDTEIKGIELKKAQGLLTEEAYQKGLYDLAIKYGQDAQTALIKYESFKTEQKKKSAADARTIQLQELQDEIDFLTQQNDLLDLDFADDQARLEQKKLLLEQEKAIELSNKELTEKEKNEIIKRYAKEEQEVDKAVTESKKAEAEARSQIQLAVANAAASAGRLLQQIAGENKSIAIAGIVLEQAAAIASIAINASKNFVKDGGVTSPLAWANLVAAGVQAASAVLAAKKGIDAINKVPIPGGGGGGGGGMASSPQITYAGAPTPMQAPQGAMTSGVNASSQIAQSLAQTTGKPIQAFVVSTQLQSQSALDRRTNRASTFSGG